MSLVKVGPKHQVVIPKDVRLKMGVKIGDYVEVAFQNNHAVIKRKKIIDDFPIADEPLNPKTRSAIRQGIKEAKEGKVSGPFDTNEDLQSHLDSLKQKR